MLNCIGDFFGGSKPQSYGCRKFSVGADIIRPAKF